ncbi:hypothetical protein CRENBAI_013348 [Crenichthys baileyi]|uniref:Uncharacterized protein n=1 Tax=Crenichthys baileyi TaxID=28760 RepID=A0AAV9R0M4_9TELE
MFTEISAEAPISDRRRLLEDDEEPRKKVQIPVSSVSLPGFLTIRADKDLKKRSKSKGEDADAPFASFFHLRVSRRQLKR